MTTLDAAWAALQAGQHSQARQATYARLREQPADVDAWLLLGAACRAAQQPFESEAAFRRACGLNAARADAPLNLGHLLRSQGRLGEAIDCYRASLACTPMLAAHLSLCEALIQHGQAREAAAHAEQVIRDGLHAVELHQCCGNAYYTLGRTDLALACYDRALALAPDQIALLYNAALAHARLGERDAALARLDRILAQDASHLNAQIKRGDLSKDAGDLATAQQAYRAALALAPKLAEVHNNLGATLYVAGHLREAIDSYRTALELGLGAHAPRAWLNLGNAHHALRELEDALAAYKRGLAIAPDDASLLAEATHIQQKLCEWDDFDALRRRVVEPILQWDAAGPPPSAFAFVALPADISPAEQQAVAARYARYVTSMAGRPLAPRTQRAAGPIRIGYVSADFYNHATAHLMLGLFRLHDRRQVRVHAYSFGPDDGSEYRRRIVADSDVFCELGAMTDRAAAERIRADSVDILIDLKGFTGAARPTLFAMRPAPLQVQWLGYPGTMGAEWIDYIVADRTVLPPEDVAHYSEAPIWMPHSYQVNDSEQPIDAATPSRAECGLPDEGFVFCCFNSPYKIDPEVFAVWMQLLRDVPGSVLWLYAGTATTNANLKRQAQLHGVDASRLVFARTQGKPQHLARHRLADLFLDTLYYNAHTTTSDALWAGLPVLTVPGRTFAARVAASLLRAVGLDELIMPDLASYAATARALANDSARLAALRRKLHAVRGTAPLFDTARFARDLDRAYVQIWHRHQAGLAPASLELSA